VFTLTVDVNGGMDNWVGSTDGILPCTQELDKKIAKSLAGSWQFCRHFADKLLDTQ